MSDAGKEYVDFIRGIQNDFFNPKERSLRNMLRREGLLPSRRGCFYFIEPTVDEQGELFELINVYTHKDREPRGKAWRRMKQMIDRKHPGIYGTKFD